MPSLQKNTRDRNLKEKNYLKQSWTIQKFFPAVCYLTGMRMDFAGERCEARATDCAAARRCCGMAMRHCLAAMRRCLAAMRHYLAAMRHYSAAMDSALRLAIRQMDLCHSGCPSEIITVIRFPIDLQILCKLPNLKYMT